MTHGTTCNHVSVSLPDKADGENCLYGVLGKDSEGAGSVVLVDAHNTVDFIKNFRHIFFICVVQKIEYIKEAVLYTETNKQFVGEPVLKTNIRVKIAVQQCLED